MLIKVIYKYYPKLEKVHNNKETLNNLIEVTSQGGIVYN